LFSIVKEKLERIQVADENQFLDACKRFWEVRINKNWRPYFRLGCAGFQTEVKAMEDTSDDKKILYVKVPRILIRRDWRTYLLTRR
jgi:hypothetical protein